MVQCSAFCLSLLSPVLRTMICEGCFRESTERQLQLDDEDERALRLTMELGCGGEGGVKVRDVMEMIGVGVIADRYQMVEVAAAAAEALARSVTVDSCGEVLGWSGGGQLPRAVSAARKLALKRFDTFSRSEGFMALQEDVLCDLVGDDELAADEEEVLEAVVAWIMHGSDEGRGEGLLREVRYGLMEASRLGELAQRAGEMLAGPQGVHLHDLALESLAVQLKPVRERGLLGVGCWAARRSSRGWAQMLRGGTTQEGGGNTGSCGRRRGTSVTLLQATGASYRWQCSCLGCVDN